MTHFEIQSKAMEDCAKPNCYLPARYVLSFLLFWAMCLEYAHRVCLSVTIVAMVNHTALDQQDNASSPTDDTCDVPSGVNATQPDEEGNYLWTPSTQGVVLGAYFYGYVCTQVFGGRLAEVIGGKWVIGLSIFLGSLLTLATPVAAEIGIVAIVLLRVFMGLIHGVCLPAAFAMFAHWAPVDERSTLIAICLVGDHIGTILSMPLAGYLCEYGFAGGWPSVYYILGVLGCVWFVFWCCFAYNRPSEHPRISQWEINHIKIGQIQITDGQKLPVPWREVLCSARVWSVSIVSFCSNWGFTTLLTKLPTYLEVVLHVPIQKNGLVNSMVYVSSCITLFFTGYLSDYLKSKNLSTTKVRKGFQIFATMGPALCLALIPVVKCDYTAAVCLLVGATAFIGFSGGGHMPIVADMAPHHAATLFGLVNGIGCTAGIFSPLIAGFLLDTAHSSLEQWSLVFYISSALYVVGGVVFLVFASAERQPWAKISCEEKLCTAPYVQSGSINSYKKTETLNKYGTIS